MDIERDLDVGRVINIDDPIEKAISMCSNHPSISRIEEGHTPKRFSFLPISSKAYQKYDIPPKILKEHEDILCADITNCIAKGEFSY